MHLAAIRSRSRTSLQVMGRKTGLPCFSTSSESGRKRSTSCNNNRCETRCHERTRSKRFNQCRKRTGSTRRRLMRSGRAETLGSTKKKMTEGLKSMRWSCKGSSTRKRPCKKRAYSSKINTEPKSVRWTGWSRMPRIVWTTWRRHWRNGNRRTGSANWRSES